VTRRSVGMFMTIVGSALGTWWIVARQRTRAARAAAPDLDRGTVIFDNTPHASEADPIV
jgi:hypothetical protein